MKYYLAVDIGASSGRHMLGTYNNGKMELEEIYRFENGMIDKNGHLCWDTKRLFKEIKNGMKKCMELGKIPVSMGIDTWGVDYVLLDGNDEIIGDSYGYRDSRTAGMDEKVYETISAESLYKRTGIQKQMFNTIYQLMSVLQKSPFELRSAKTFLMLPDYFHFLLTGVKSSEYTEATTSQLINPHTNEWDYVLLEQLCYPKEIFQPIQLPGTELGDLKKDIQEEVGFNCKVILPATHDTGSAVMAVPTLTGECLYISSGTWSLMGIENETAICTEESRMANLTNEGGYDCRFRFLKNIMGLWMIQSVRHELNDAYSFSKICEYAEQEKDFPSRVDVNDDSFMAPANMTEAIKDYLRKTGQRVPENLGQLATVIYQSLAESYAQTIGEIESISKKHFAAINIVGGGSNASYLNQLTADKTGRTVYAGPSEATAIGNVTAQMIEEGEFENLAAARKVIFDSFEVKTYNPA